MPTTPINVNFKKTGKNINIEAKHNGDIIERVLDAEFLAPGNRDTAAEWLINQDPDASIDKALRGTLTVDWHPETVTNPETGTETTVRVVDSWEFERFDFDTVWDGLEIDEIEAQIDGISNINGVKAALKQVARKLKGLDDLV